MDKKRDVRTVLHTKWCVGDQLIMGHHASFVKVARYPLPGDFAVNLKGLTVDVFPGFINGF